MVQETGSAGAWEVADVAGHPASVYEPNEPHPQGYVAIYLHPVGCEDLADDPVYTALLNQYGLRAIAPRAGESWWSDCIYPPFDNQRTAEQYVVRDVMAYIEQRWSIKPPRVGLLGISMGGQAALRMAYKYFRQFPVAVAVAPAIDYHLWLQQPTEQTEIVPALRELYRDSEDARQDTATLHLHPLAWPPHQFFCSDPLDHWHEGADRLQMKLSSLGISHECDLETSAGGHGWPYFHKMAPTAIEFLVDRLEQERLQVV